ncbi:unnamed protein product [Meloidogyne enterolobii]|uniref:Uncharacterized protein n=1 Tax=Meloidogyne enterolobii TaxID=390850 RepID=A0ACB0YK60_MELEN
MGPTELKGFYYQHKRENGQLDYKIVSLQELRRYAVRFPLDKWLKEEWETAIDMEIPMYSYTGRWDRPKYYHYLRLTDEESQNLILKLPVYPKNIEEMKIIRFCLIQLFKISSFTFTIASVSKEY